MNGHEQLINVKLKKDGTTLNEASVLINNNFWNASVNRTYYACFYAVGALLLTKDIKPVTHKGIQTMFNKQFVLNGTFPRELSKFYSNLYGSRHLGDYGDFIDFDEGTAKGFFSTAKVFIAEIESIIKK